MRRTAVIGEDAHGTRTALFLSGAMAVHAERHGTAGGRLLDRFVHLKILDPRGQGGAINACHHCDAALSTGGRAGQIGAQRDTECKHHVRAGHE